MVTLDPVLLPATDSQTFPKRQKIENGQTPSLITLTPDLLALITERIQLPSFHNLMLTCQRMKEIGPDLIARDSQKISALFKVLFEQRDEVRINGFLSRCKQSQYGTVLHITIEKEYPSLGFLETIQRKFPYLFVDTWVNSGDTLNTLFATCSNMRGLTMKHAFLMRPFQLSITAIPRSLETLNLRAASILADHLCQILNSCNRLKSLNLSHCNRDFSTLPFPSTLEELDVSKTTINDTGLSNICKSCPELRVLNLDSCSNLTCEGMASSALPSSLEEINLREVSLDDQGLSNILERCKNLTHLDLRNTLCVSADYLATAQFSSTLRELGIEGMRNKSLYGSIDERTLANILQRCPKLKKLDLHYVQELTESVSFERALFNSTLEEIGLPGAHLNRAALLNIFQRCPKLTKLDLGNCQKLTAVDLATAPFPDTILEMDVSSGNLDSSGLLNLLQRCPKLRILNIFFCKNLSENDVKATIFPKSLKEVKSEYLKK